MHLLKLLLVLFLVLFTTTLFAQDPLHITRSGKDYWYGKPNGGFENLSDVPITQLPCVGCHGANDADGNAYGDPYTPNCIDCHPSNSAFNPDSLSVDQCKTCHGRIKKEIALGYTDVHTDAEGDTVLVCWDCHTSPPQDNPKNSVPGNDMHGTGYNAMWDAGAIGASCDSCHTGPNKIKAIPDHSTVDPHQGKLHCTSCHAKSVITCYNCHFESQIVNKKRSKGALHNFVILVNSDKHNQVYPASFQSITWQDTTFVAFAPYYPHTITDEGRTCNDCHENQYVQDWNNGNGEIKFASFEEGTQTLTAKPGVIPLPPDYQTTFKMDYIDYTGNPTDDLPGTANWELIGKDVADLTQLLFATPLTADQMADLAAVVSIDDGDMTVMPTEFALRQNYPNPFNPSTTIEFMLPKSATVTVKVFDVTGAEVNTIIGGENYSAGSHKVTFNAAGLASGIYFYRLSVGSLSGETADFMQTKKMFLLR